MNYVRMNRVREALRYGAVGLGNTVMYVLLYSLLVVAGIPYALAAVLAFPAPVAVGYWLHEHWTFRRGEPSRRGLTAFMATQVAALGLSLVLLVALVDVLGMGPIVARVITTPAAPIFTYLVGRAWIFALP